MVKKDTKKIIKRGRPSKMTVKEEAAEKRMAADKARLAKKSVVKIKSAPKIQPNADIGEIDIRLKAQFDNNTKECIHITNASFSVDKLESDILIKAIVSFIVPYLVKIDNKNGHKNELLVELLSTMHKFIFMELKLMGQPRDKLPTKLRDILDHMYSTK